MRYLSMMCSLATLVVSLSALEAATIHVPGDYATIQDAMNAAVDGDTVLVAPGTYHERVSFFGKAITLTSEQGPEVTIIDGDQAGSVVTFASGEGLASVLSGFTLQNGRGDFEGGGIRIANASPTIMRNVIRSNGACAGAGIAIGFGSPT
ncbi:MAG TPA: hypothetical protein VLK82_09690, partial [Candidatus Tectomicrobia bacterium]|nr:hypothetical protein [Candidatus Tectomicrobia bacterium]